MRANAAAHSPAGTYCVHRGLLFTKLVRTLKCKLLWLLLPLLLIGGCSPAPVVETGGEVNLWVTKDFGGKEIYGETLAIAPGQTVMSLLQGNLDIETEYGGGFVNTIAGLASGYTTVGSEQQRVDWFYYVNGITSNLGATDYIPTPGDIIWWDYHPWGNISFTPAVIGAFPQPFVNGYYAENPGTLILAGKGYEDLAQQLATYLQGLGVVAVEVKPYAEELASRRTKNTLVIAAWEQLQHSSYWQGIQENREQTGWFAQLDVQCFSALDLRGEIQDSFSSQVGAVLATGTGLGDATPLWLLTATDRQGLEQVVSIVLERPEELAKMVGALIVEGEVVALPAR